MKMLCLNEHSLAKLSQFLGQRWARLGDFTAGDFLATHNIFLINKERKDAGVQPRPQGRGCLSLVVALVLGRGSNVALRAVVRREEEGV